MTEPANDQARGAANVAAIRRSLAAKAAEITVDPEPAQQASPPGAIRLTFGGAMVVDRPLAAFDALWRARSLGQAPALDAAGVLWTVTRPDAAAPAAREHLAALPADGEHLPRWIAALLDHDAAPSAVRGLMDRVGAAVEDARAARKADEVQPAAREAAG